MEDNSTLKIIPSVPEKLPDDNLPPGSLLNHGKYRVERVLGRGGFGVTYLALDCTLGLRVAVKECLPKSAAWRNASGGPVQWGLSAPEQDAMLENFVREARKMAKIDQIPGVVRVREYFYDNSTAYIVMDYVDGETLAQRLARTGPMSAEECFGLLSPVMDALALAHGRGLVHRDISPNNIMIENGGGKVWLLDLGAAKDMGKRAFAPNVSNGTQIVGTPGYMPMEQYDPDGKIGPWTDVYAMSAVFFRCITGQTPQPSTSRAFKDPVPELLNPMPGKVGAALRKGLAQDLDERYQTMTELRDALEQAVRTKPKSPQKALLPVVVVAVLLLIALSVILTRPKLAIEQQTGGETQTADALQTGDEAQTEDVLQTGEEAQTDVEPVTETENEVEPLPNIIASGECGENASWTLDEDGLLTISGSGNMAAYLYIGFDFDTSTAPWFGYRDAISSVRIQGIANIGKDSFYKCENLQTVEISDSVETIGEQAFSNCTALTGITIPNGVTEIGWHAFSGCRALTSVTIPDSLTEINSGTFAGCTSLSSVTIPDSVTVIHNNAFVGCTSLSSVTIPDSVVAIGLGAFSGCTSLVSVSVPSGVNIYIPFDENTTVTTR